MFEISLILSLKKFDSKMRKIYFLLLVAAVVMGCNQNQEHREKPPVRVVTETAGRSEDAFRRTFTGIVEEKQAVAVSFTSRGVVKTVAVSEGQQVVKGQLIAQIDDTQARNMLAASEAAASQADDAYNRFKQLRMNIFVFIMR